MHRTLLVVSALAALARAAAAQPAPAAVEVTASRVEVDHQPVLGSDAVFDLGEATVRASARPLLDEIAKALGKDATSTVTIVVHTDDTAPDSDRSGAFNTKLSQARADALAAYLGKHGVAAKRLVSRGRGQAKPVADNASEDGRRQNRRIELLVTGEVRPPDAADLAAYTQKLKGKGALIATLTTNLGAIHCQLFEDKTPTAVANFVGLATGQKPWLDPQTGRIMRGKPFYDGLTFHRVIPKFMIQGGDPLGRGTGGPGYTFDDELSPELTHKPGTLAMANAGPGTNGSQFFINEVEAPWLNNKHTIIGLCKDLDVIGAIGAVPRGAGDRPNEPVTISKGASPPVVGLPISQGRPNESTTISVKL